MLLSFSDLKKYRGQVAMVDGAFDPIHQGHIAYFKAAAELGVPVLCNIASDAYTAGKHAPFLVQDKRAQVIDAIGAIEYVHPNGLDTEAVLRELQPKYYVKGNDWEGKLPEEQVSICKELGIEIRYLDCVLDSSTRILDTYSGATPDIAEFEKFLFSQGSTADEYDSDYFTDMWREEDNAYTVEARRKIEGKHPEKVKEVFAPERVLDMGCGPGVLMYLLHEVGITAHGVDVSETSKTLAPPEVRENIHVGSITDIDLPDDSYDLVICREVIEHLTVLQVQKAVENLCRISSRYVYVTTRFHSDPRDLFDVTTEFDVDPTHITLMNKDMLRLLFNMQGMRRRPDLEKGIDWMDKRRVLVYEKERNL